MSLKIMIAGCGKDEREGIEASIREAFGTRADDSWNVSLVHVANQWSVEIDGPEPRFKGLSFVAPPEDLAASVRRALKAAGAEETEAAPAAAPPAPTPVPSQPQPQPQPTPPPPAAMPAAAAAAKPPSLPQAQSAPTPPPPMAAPPAAPTAAGPAVAESAAGLPLLELETEPGPALTPAPVPSAEQTLTSMPAASTANAAAPAPAGVVQTPLVDGDRTERHECEGCSAPFDVFYYAIAGERMEKCPVACPSCWHVNNVPIAAGAGLNGDYRAQATS